MTIKLNNKKYTFDRLEDFACSRKGRYHVTHLGTHNTYTIEGGKHFGGSKRDWFVDGKDFKGSIACTSVIDALRMLDRM